MLVCPQKSSSWTNLSASCNAIASESVCVQQPYASSNFTGWLTVGVTYLPTYLTSSYLPTYLPTKLLAFTSSAFCQQQLPRWPDGGCHLPIFPILFLSVTIFQTAYLPTYLSQQQHLQLAQGVCHLPTYLPTYLHTLLPLNCLITLLTSELPPPTYPLPTYLLAISNLTRNDTGCQLPNCLPIAYQPT